MDSVKSKALFFMFLLVLLPMMSVFSQEDPFEDLDWQLLYPDEILKEASTEIDFSAGFFLSGDPSFGSFFQLNPQMHFLIFDGKFNLTVEQKYDAFGTYFDLANEEVSDYFDYTKVKYKNLLFYFGLDNRLNSKMVFLPRMDFNRKYIHFDYRNLGWQLDIKSPEWSAWAFDFSTPSLSFGDWGIRLDADAFIDNSASATYAISAGPGISYKEFFITPIVGYEHFGLQTSELEEYDPIFDAGSDHLFLGMIGTFEKDEIAFNGGFKYSSELNPFLSVKLGPLEFSTGKALFLAHEKPGRRWWADVYWNFEIDGFVSTIGFSNEINYNDIWASSLFADFEFRVYENLFLDIRLIKDENWLFKMGARYHTKLEFY